VVLEDLDGAGRPVDADARDVPRHRRRDAGVVGEAVGLDRGSARAGVGPDQLRDRDGPLGAKGIGEAPVIAGPAAIANAVAAATGLRLRDLPMSRARVWAALRDG
jgi:hypothetical protein